MNAIRLGEPAKLVKGVVDVTYFDPATGNIVGYETMLQEAGFTVGVNYEEVTAGFGNPVVGIIPDSVRPTGTYTNAAFDLQTRALITGGELSYNGVAAVCETITAPGTTLTVTNAPAKHYGQSASDEYAWCYVRQHGSTQYMGTNYGVDLTSKQVVGFTATEGVQYDVFYFTENASAQVLAIPEAYRPAVVTVQEKYGVYTNENNIVTQSTFAGYMYVVVPKAILTGDAGMSGNQSSASTTSGAWTALPPEKTVMDCDACGSSASPIMYYIFVPCAGSTSAVEDLVVVGGGVSVAVGETATVPVKYLMPDDTVVQPTYTDLSFTSASTSVASVSASGVVTGNTAGTTEITVTLTKGDGTVLTTYCNVTVTSA